MTRNASSRAIDGLASARASAGLGPYGAAFPKRLVRNRASYVTREAGALVDCRSQREAEMASCEGSFGGRGHDRQQRGGRRQLEP